jgi:hypothetical protein
MAFCPDCEAEYKTGITVCPDCNAELVPELTPENKLHDTSDADPVPLRSFGTSPEAEMVLELLERNGIRAFVEGGGFAVPFGNASGVVVMVDERDLVRAVELYEAYFESEPAPSTENQTDTE